MIDIYNKVRMIMNSSTVQGYFIQVVPITCLVGIVYAVLRLVRLKRKNRPVAWPAEIMRFLFVCYLTGLLNLVVLPANTWLHLFDGLFFDWWNELDDFFRIGEIQMVPSIVYCLQGCVGGQRDTQ